MLHPLTFYLTAISFLIVSKVSNSSGELVILRDTPTGNDSSVNLTCVSEDDGAALIWNYYYNANEYSSERNIPTDFEPKKPLSKNSNECALWNHTRCFGKWENSKDWNLVESAVRPMAPVFDYRWEGFREIFSDPLTQNQEYHYVREVKEPSGTVVFSARGSRDVYIILCEREDPEKGACFCIIIGSRMGTRSEIRSCVNGTLRLGQYSTLEQCADVAKVTHGSARIIDAYEWRTFRLEWSTESKTIKIFNSTDVDPFLESVLDEWHPVSHLLVKNTRSRIRFHFYEYFLTTKKNAVLSTTEFLQHDKHLCLELMVGLCPECRLNVTLTYSGDDIPIKIISGLKNSGRNDLLTWRSVRLDASSLDLNSKLMKLNLVTVLSKNGVEGRWAIDNLRTCEPVGGLRKSTIRIHRRTFTSTISLWPEVKCQKLSYTGNNVVDSPIRNPHIFGGASSMPRFERTPGEDRLTVNLDQGSQASGNGAVDNNLIYKREAAAKNTEIIDTPVFPSAASEVNTHTEYKKTVLGKTGGSLLDRKVHGRYRRDDVGRCEMYELDNEANTISVRLKKSDFEHYQFDSVSVSIVVDGKSCCVKEFPAQNGKLDCKLWDNATCFENVNFTGDAAKLKKVKLPWIQVHGSKIGEKESEMAAHCELSWGLAENTPPLDL